jgi:2-polyprenyl-3-methyl-5-hydroxy-6-metoxy-1,4-benzoquinol methylase
MAYQDFLVALAREQKVPSVESLLAEHADRYAFQINSRQRAANAVGILKSRLGEIRQGAKVLDVGCAYGSFSIELAKLGAKPVGIDISDKWLRLAAANAKDEVDVPFLHCDAANRSAIVTLQPYGPFEIVIANDVFEHIFDTAGLLHNLTSCMTENAIVYFKVPNGMATRSVLSEGHKKVFGISLLAPDYWPLFVGHPFHIYYRRWSYFSALFDAYGLEHATLNTVTDTSRDHTVRAIKRDLSAIRAKFREPDVRTAPTYRILFNACRAYIAEVEADIEALDWEILFRKYRVTFWEGFLRPSARRRAQAY